jgi:hypothetical protein
MWLAFRVVVQVTEQGQHLRRHDDGPRRACLGVLGADGQLGAGEADVPPGQRQEFRLSHSSFQRSENEGSQSRRGVFQQSSLLTLLDDVAVRVHHVGGEPAVTFRAFATGERLPLAEEPLVQPGPR